MGREIVTMCDVCAVDGVVGCVQKVIGAVGWMGGLTDDMNLRSCTGGFDPT